MDLKEFRNKKFLLQCEMAEVIGVSPSYYHKVESGVRKPSFAFLEKLKKEFPEASIDEMFFGKTKRQ